MSLTVLLNSDFADHSRYSVSVMPDYPILLIAFVQGRSIVDASEAMDGHRLREIETDMGPLHHFEARWGARASQKGCQMGAPGLKDLNPTTFLR